MAREPFDTQEEPIAPKIGIKNVSSQKSIFENIPKKPKPEDLEKKVSQMYEQKSLYKDRFADLTIKFADLIKDKTLKQNKNVFAKTIENDILKDMLVLAREVNTNPNEPEGEGSLGLITLLFRACLGQRDKINQLEFSILENNKKLDLISKQISSLDKS